MKSYNAAYIVQLLGVVSDGQPALIVMEYMAKGNLRDYLRFTRAQISTIKHKYTGPVDQMALTTLRI